MVLMCRRSRRSGLRGNALPFPRTLLQPPRQPRVRQERLSRIHDRKAFQVARELLAAHLAGGDEHRDDHNRTAGGLVLQRDDLTDPPHRFGAHQPQRQQLMLVY